MDQDDTANIYRHMQGYGEWEKEIWSSLEGWDLRFKGVVQALGLAKIRHEGRKIVPSIKGRYQGTVNFTLGRQLS